MLALESSVSQAQWSKVKKQLDDLSKLEVEQPIESLYFNGLVSWHLKNYQSAQAFLEQYVIRAGDAGKYYASALELITSSEELLNIAPAEVIEKISVKPTILENGERGGYIKSLQALYLTDSPVQALVMQINSLLSSHPFTGSRVKKAGGKEGLIFRISVKGDVVLLQEKSYQQGLPTLSASTLNVLGLDPFLKFDCSNREYACWLYHPANSHQRWLTIDQDELVAGELSDALSKLIQELQKTI